MFAPFQCAMNELSLLCLTNTREVGFELLADAREIGVNRVRLYRHVVKADKGEVEVQGRTVVVPGTNINGLSKCNCLFSDKSLS